MPTSTINSTLHPSWLLVEPIVYLWQHIISENCSCSQVKDSLFQNIDDFEQRTLKVLSALIMFLYTAVIDTVHSSQTTINMKEIQTRNSSRTFSCIQLKWKAQKRPMPSLQQVKLDQRALSLIAAIPRRKRDQRNETIWCLLMPENGVKKLRYCRIFETFTCLLNRNSLFSYNLWTRDGNGFLWRIHKWFSHFHLFGL